MKSPYHQALAKNRAEIAANIAALRQLKARREMEVAMASHDIDILDRSIAFHTELAAQIDMELNLSRA